MLPGDLSRSASPSTASGGRASVHLRAAHLLLVVLTALATACAVQLVHAPTAAAAPAGTPSAAPAHGSTTAPASPSPTFSTPSSTAAAPRPTSPFPSPSSSPSSAPSSSPDGRPAGSGPKTAAAGADASAGLSLSAAADPTAVTRVGQEVAYTVAVRNRGDQSVRDLLVSAPSAGVSALACSPVALGGVLAAGATTTCRATRTIAVADLRGATLADRVEASATVGTGSATTVLDAAVTLSVAVQTPAPKATDDSVPAINGGPDVILPGAANDGPAEAGGPGLDPSRTSFVGAAPDPVYGTKVATTAQGRWSILPNGSVRFSPGLGHPGTTAQLAYRVFDLAGRSAVGQLRVPLRRGPVAAPHTLSTAQGGYFYVDLLKLDDPGQAADGTPATFVRTSLRLTGVSPTAGFKINYISDRSSIRIAGVGDFAVANHEGFKLVFDTTLNPYFTGTVPTLSYTALTTAGTSVNGTVSVEVRRTTGGTAPVPDLPEAVFDDVTTTPQVPVVLAGQTNDLPGAAPLDSSKLGFPRDQLQSRPAGTTITDVGGEQVLNEPGQGSFTTNRTDGTILFTPDPGFVSPDDIPGFLGDVLAEYTITDTAGNSSRAYLHVALVPGAYTRPDAVTTRQGRSVNANVLLNDYGGRSQLIGSPGTFADPTLTTAGLPSGSAVSESGSRLTVPGQGVYAVSPGNRTVTFVPEPQFRGTATPITYAVRAFVPQLNLGPAVLDLTATLTVTVLGSDPVAKADSASTTLGHPVVVPVLANDSPGSPVVPLVGSSLRLRLSAGLPTGSTLSGDAKTLTVPGRGVFQASGTGPVTFVPLGTATGKVPAIGYQVADANGSTARSSLTVTVG